MKNGAAKKKSIKRVKVQDLDHFAGLMLDQFARVDERFEQIDERFDRMEARMERMEGDIHDIKSELSYIHKRLDTLGEQVGSQGGYAKEIDFLATRVALIEKHLGITHTSKRR